MGLSPYPTPADRGVLGIILINTAIFVSIIKYIFIYILHALGIHKTESREEYSLGSPSDVSKPDGTPLETFRSWAPAVWFGTLCGTHWTSQECSVCLAEFRHSDEINHLYCGHVFHKICLEKWLKCGNVTCPLCRTGVMPRDSEVDTDPM